MAEAHFLPPEDTTHATQSVRRLPCTSCFFHLKFIKINGKLC
jgi:hypothetical protein